VLSRKAGFDREFRSHKFLFQHGKWGIENIANLDQVPAAGAMAFIGASKVTGRFGRSRKGSGPVVTR
jgi:kynurenine formamidase